MCIRCRSNFGVISRGGSVTVELSWSFPPRQSEFHCRANAKKLLQNNNKIVLLPSNQFHTYFIRWRRFNSKQSESNRNNCLFIKCVVSNRTWHLTAKIAFIPAYLCHIHTNASISIEKISENRCAKIIIHFYRSVCAHADI